MLKKMKSTRLDAWVGPDVAILLLRVGVSGLMITHGLPKFMKILDGDFSFPDPIGLGSAASLFLVAFAEFICSILVLIGLGTRFALIPLIITMCVAAFIVHAPDPFSDKELSLFFLLTYIVLFLTGPGRYSMDKFYRKR